MNKLIIRARLEQKNSVKIMEWAMISRLKITLKDVVYPWIEMCVQAYGSDFSQKNQLDDFKRTIINKDYITSLAYTDYYVVKGE